MESIVLARTERVAVSLEDIGVFTTGVSFTLVVRLAPEEEKWRLGEALSALHGRHHGEDRPPTPLDPAVLRFGVEYSDGSRVANVWTDMLPFFGSPGGPVLSTSSGGTSDRRGFSEYWLAPLPPDGNVMFAVEWPSRGLAFTTVGLDAESFRQAARRAESLWPASASRGSGHRSVWRTSSPDPQVGGTP